METEAGAPGSGLKKRKKQRAVRTNQGGVGPGSVSKKRKLAPAETPEVAEVRAAGDQGLPPRSGKHGIDRISLIPDAILGEIVSLLPTKEGARTQFLASRWRHIWRNAPLNLDCRNLVTPIKQDYGWSKTTENSDLDPVVSRILASHQAPACRLYIPTDHGCEEAKAEAWLQSPTLDNLQELEYGSVPNYGPTKVARMWEVHTLSLPPASTFRFGATLRRANIRKCHLPDSIVQTIHFPQLKHLALHWVSISESSIHHLIARCPTLEGLLIYYIFGLHCLRINALRLRSIRVLAHFHDRGPAETRLEELVIENAPCLERLIRVDLLDRTRVSVISAPKLETLGYIDNGHPSSWRIADQHLHDYSLTMTRSLVKSLAIHMPALGLFKVIDLLGCFPCSEKLYIQNKQSMRVEGSRPKNYWRRQYRNLIGCLNICLKTIVLETYRGTVSEVNFVEFFVLNARELDLMRIQIETMDEEFIAKQERLLQLENKASRGVRFHFTTDRCLQDFSAIGPL